jgi:hypothetical protein
MIPLRRRMTEDMQIRNLTLNTQRVYVERVARFAPKKLMQVAAEGSCGSTCCA